MDENQFWLNVWRTAGAAVCCVALTIAGCESYKTSVVKDMSLKEGMDPMRAACAVNGVGERSGQICALLAVQRP